MKTQHQTGYQRPRWIGRGYLFSAAIRYHVELRHGTRSGPLCGGEGEVANENGAHTTRLCLRSPSYHLVRAMAIPVCACAPICIMSARCPHDVCRIMVHFDTHIRPRIKTVEQ